MKKPFVLLGLSLILVVVLCGAIACPAPEGTTPPTTTNAPPATTTTPPAVEQVLIRITTPAPPGDDLANWCQEGFDKFNARTNGAYKIQVFPGGQLANMPESLDLIRTGAVEGGILPLAAFSGTVPELGLVELPFLFNSQEAISSAQDDLRDLYSGVTQATCNQRVLGCFTPSTRDLLSVNKPIKTLEDLKGLIVGCDTPSDAEMMKTLGGSGIVVDFTEDYSNLQKGVIDAKTSGPTYMLVAKLDEVAHYFTIYHGVCAFYEITLNSDVYNKMPQDIQDILTEEMTAQVHTINQRYIAQVYDAIDVLTENGVEIYYMPAAERDKWKDLVYPGTLARLAEFGDVGAKLTQIAEEADINYPYTLPEGQ